MDKVVSKITAIIRLRQRSANSVSNAGIIRLFWDIGYVVNSTLRNADKKTKDDEMKGVGNILNRIYGRWLNYFGIKEMSRFNNLITDFDEVRVLAAFISWKDVSRNLSLPSGVHLTTSLEHTVRNSLIAQDLHKVLRTNTEGDHATGKEKGLLGQYELYNLFKSDTLPYLKMILHPKRISGLNLSPLKKKFFTDITALIGSFRIEFQSWIDMQFTLCMWEIGKELKRHHIENSDRQFTTVRAALPKAYRAFLTTNSLNTAFSFATYFSDISEAGYIAETFSWKQIHVLLQLNSKGDMIFIGNHAVADGWSLKRLKEEVTSFLNNPGRSDGVPEQDGYNSEALPLLPEKGKSNHFYRKRLDALAKPYLNFLIA